MLMEVLMDAGVKIPEQMSIVAMDDSDIARMGVRGVTVSSIPHPKAELGKRAAQNMIRMIHSGQIAYNATHEFREDVILRDSVRRVE